MPTPPERSKLSGRSDRTSPNILVTGTPGTGKTTFAELVAQELGLNHVNVGALVKEKGLHEGYDQSHQSYVLDDDKVVDELEPSLAAGGNVVDFHSCELFPERWFDLVLVLRTNNTLLYDRLEKRGYSQEKITENIECEIFQVVLEEARESYAEEIVVELPSDVADDLDSSVDRVKRWYEAWTAQRAP